jgi:hypothetical protein
LTLFHLIRFTSSNNRLKAFLTTNKGRAKTSFNYGKNRPIDALIQQERKAIEHLTSFIYQTVGFGYQTSGIATTPIVQAPNFVALIFWK